jgi:hypothetical protein
MANPMQFIVKEINDYTQQYKQATYNNNPFACLTVHSIKIQGEGP